MSASIRFFYRHRTGMDFRQILPAEANWIAEQMEESPGAFPEGACLMEDRRDEYGVLEIPT